MSKKTTILWLDAPEAHDYPAAEAYLSLIYQPRAVADFIKALQQAALSQFKAKDIFRASALSLLGISNANVEKNKEKILAGTKLSPLLLVRDSVNGKVVIADGYHRLCSVYTFDEEADIPCKIV